MERIPRGADAGAGCCPGPAAHRYRARPVALDPEEIGELSWRRRLARRLAPVAVGAALAVIAIALVDGGPFGGDGTPPQLGVESGEKEAAVKLGFPAIATKNTLRIGGGDAISDVAGVASAVFPATGRGNRPTAVVLVDGDDWQGAVAAAVLGAGPIGVPILLSDGGELPVVSRETLARLDPKGSDLAGDAKAIRIGDKPPEPGGMKTTEIEGDGPYTRAAAIDRFSTTARKRPSANVIVASGERAEFAMPAAAWAARSGDSVLFVKRGEVPRPTRRAIERHDKPRIFILGPRAVVGREVERRLRRLGRVRRVSGATPVQNAIALARYQRGDFGWGISVPGYNFALASTDRPADAAAAAALAGNGVFAPLLLTDSAKKLPRSLENYLLDVQPGYQDDPGEGVYNRVWLLGDEDTISIPMQGRIDEISQLVPVQVRRP